MHNRGVKWDVASFIRFLKVIVCVCWGGGGIIRYSWSTINAYYLLSHKWLHQVHNNFPCVCVYIRLNEILKFSNFIFYVISIITGEHLLLVMNGNMVSMIRVWLVLILNVLLWLCLIIDYWFNFLSEYNNWFYCTVKFLMFFIW